MIARILIIEDNVDNLELMAYLLKSSGYKLFTATDGVSGLEIIKNNQLDLVICDIQLPMLDGNQIAHYLKNHLSFQQIPLLAVTALAMVGDRNRIIASGFDGYLPKPLTPETFVKEIEAFLPQHLHASKIVAS